ncbi:MAG TPA: DUF389 domain-containing protein [Hanamia sp.]|nr:DUF389 domain-containing protein [Hanamia sp.]
MSHFLDKFNLNKEREEYQTVIDVISNDLEFRGTRLWILIFAIFVASLGLNVNAPAVVIGAMLISPLMSPIMGIGLGIGINDMSLLRKAVNNYVVAALTGLGTSTVFFLMSPLSEAHSEILARTSPNIYDVLIALFGGLAGIIATSSKQKGNVIPGVAIATALMPPLCTAGYGLATFQLNYFVGAFYLFIINTVFIALATFLMVRALRFPMQKFLSKELMNRAHRIVWIIVIATLLPSIYLGYNIVMEEKFSNSANNFINYEARFPNDYLLSKTIDPKRKKISLVFGGKEITPMEIQRLKAKMKQYGMDTSSLEIKQGFAYLAPPTNTSDERYNLLSNALSAKEKEETILRAKLDSINNDQKLGKQVFAELKVQYPQIKSGIIEPTTAFGDSSKNKRIYLVLLNSKGVVPASDRTKIEKWMKVRLQQQYGKDSLSLIFR